MTIKINPRLVLIIVAVLFALTILFIIVGQIGQRGSGQSPVQVVPAATRSR